MAKEKNITPKDEPVKLDMSFKDALSLAAKTPPMIHLEIIANDRREIKEVQGRIITFIQININEPDQDVNNFEILIEVEKDNGEKYQSSLLPHNFLQFGLSNVGNFSEISQRNFFDINNDERLFVTVLSKDKTITLKTFLTFTKKTRF